MLLVIAATPPPATSDFAQHFERAIMDADATYVMGNILYTYDELVDALNAEGARLPPETWRDGVWDVNDYMIEASQVGIIVQIFPEDAE